MSFTYIIKIRVSLYSITIAIYSFIINKNSNKLDEKCCLEIWYPTYIYILLEISQFKDVF